MSSTQSAQITRQDPTSAALSSPMIGRGPDPDAVPTIAGLTPYDLHVRFWAARGIQVVTPGDDDDVSPAAKYYLLADGRWLMLFDLREVVDVLTWVRPSLVSLRLRASDRGAYRERIVADEGERFVAAGRDYRSRVNAGRVIITEDRRLARMWREASDSHTAWRKLKFMVPKTDRVTVAVEAKHLARRGVRDEQIAFAQRLVEIWSRPHATIDRLSHRAGGAWVDDDALVHPDASIVGPVWIGAGHHIGLGTSVVGPAVLWDVPEAKVPARSLAWSSFDPGDAAPVGARLRGGLLRPPRADRGVKVTHPAKFGPVRRAVKRAFDITFSLAMILCTLPVWLIAALAVYLEDGTPILFAHTRESRGGREFPCLKFRSMRKDADEIKKRLLAENMADGPQFFIDDDPRVTRVGAILRKTNIDELPQFINVLLGHMSVVGPRPSPHAENQFSPQWREARLSVRPGITGLWQVKRQRNAGEDFQEWIRYDIEYVENMSLLGDLRIILATIGVILKRGSRTN